MKNLLILLCLVFTAPALAEIKVLAFAGSTRKDSYNKKLVQEAAQIARSMGTSVKVIDLKDFSMPHYDEDLEKSDWMPVNAKNFRRLMIESDAIIISTPEYNGSIPGVLKNALDWASRSEDGQGSREAFKGKHFAIMGASPGGGGGIRGLIHLRSIISAIGGDVVPQQVTVSNVSGTFFDEEGHIKNANIQMELKEEIQQLIKNVQADSARQNVIRSAA